MSLASHSRNGVASPTRNGGLLSLEESGVRASPLRSWSEEQVARVRTAAGAAVDSWRAAWTVSPPCTGVACVRAAEAPESSSESWSSLAGVRGAWLRFSGTARGLTGIELGRSELRLELFGTKEETPVANELVGDAWHDLEQRLASELGPKSEAGQSEAGPGRTVWLRWSGALLLSVPWWSAQLRLLLSGETVERFLFPSGRPAVKKVPSGGLVPLSRALASRRVGVEVQLEPFELEVGALASMRVGDVLRTTHRLERPLMVEVGGARAESVLEWSGFLGRAGSNKAVELVGESRKEP